MGSTVEILGTVVLLTELRSDVAAAIIKGYQNRYAFTPETVTALLDKVERLTGERDELLAALVRMDALMEMLWKAVPRGQTFNLNIMELNEAPPQAKRAIAKARGE